MCLREFIPLEVLWDSWICGFFFSSYILKNSLAIISSYSYSISFFSSSFETQISGMLDHFDIVPKLFGALFCCGLFATAPHPSRFIFEFLFGQYPLTYLQIQLFSSAALGLLKSPLEEFFISDIVYFPFNVLT